eukprot:g19806.t1
MALASLKIWVEHFSLLAFLWSLGVVAGTTGVRWTRQGISFYKPPDLTFFIEALVNALQISRYILGLLLVTEVGNGRPDLQAKFGWLIDLLCFVTIVCCYSLPAAVVKQAMFNTVASGPHRSIQQTPPQPLRLLLKSFLPLVLIALIGGVLPFLLPRAELTELAQLVVAVVVALLSIGLCIHFRSAASMLNNYLLTCKIKVSKEMTTLQKRMSRGHHVLAILIVPACMITILLLSPAHAALAAALKMVEAAVLAFLLSLFPRIFKLESFTDKGLEAFRPNQIVTLDESGNAVAKTLDGAPGLPVSKGSKGSKATRTQEVKNVASSLALPGRNDRLRSSPRSSVDRMEGSRAQDSVLAQGIPKESTEDNLPDLSGQGSTMGTMGNHHRSNHNADVVDVATTSENATSRSTHDSANGSDPNLSQTSVGAAGVQENPENLENLDASLPRVREVVNPSCREVVQVEVADLTKVVPECDVDMSIVNEPERSRAGPAGEPARTEEKSEEDGKMEEPGKQDVQEDGEMEEPPEKHDVQVYLDLAATQARWWRDPSVLSWRDMFHYPNPINALEARLNAYMVCVCLILTVLMDQLGYQPFFLFWVIYGYSIRTLCGPRLDPQAQFAIFVLRPLVEDRLGWMDSLFVPGPPKRFAQLLGGCTAILALLSLYLAPHIVFVLVVNMLFLLSLWQASFDLCAGCLTFYILILLGVVPAEVCEVCSTTYQINPDDVYHRGKGKKKKASNATPSMHVSADNSVVLSKIEDEQMILAPSRRLSYASYFPAKGASNGNSLKGSRRSSLGAFTPQLTPQDKGRSLSPSPSSR